MFIIKLIANEYSSRPPIQTWSLESAPEGFAFCPDDFVPMFTASKGFVNIVVENDVVTSMTENSAAKKAWEESLPEPIEPQPSPDEDRDAMLADQEYRLTMLELGLT